VLIEADYLGAELLGAGLMSGDKQLIDHAQRASLPEDDPNFYDIHSNVTVMAFRLDCPPTKHGLESIGKAHLRVAAKSVIFGYFYGRGAKAISLALREEGVDVTIEQAQTIIDAISRLYPDLAAFFERCARRAIQDRWMCGCFGGYRRFPVARDQKLEGDIERQGQNFLIQNMVADAINRALDYLIQYRDQFPEIAYRLLLQIHDAIVLEVPYEHADFVKNVVLPYAMSECVPIYPVNLNGVPNGTGPFRMGIDTEVFLAWGEKMMPNDYLSRGMSPEMSGWKQADRGWLHASKPKDVWVGDATGGSWEALAA
jgi:DNA polymerase I-like protein with 3'-5' exonuclease and polymerase domains